MDVHWLSPLPHRAYWTDQGLDAQRTFCVIINPWSLFGCSLNHFNAIKWTGFFVCVAAKMLIVSCHELNFCINCSFFILICIFTLCLVWFYFLSICLICCQIVVHVPACFSAGFFRKLNDMFYLQYPLFMKIPLAWYFWNKNTASHKWQ